MHPLDPLNRDELDRAIQIIREQMDLPVDALFEQVRLKEPLKALVHAFNTGSAPRYQEKRSRLCWTVPRIRSVRWWFLYRQIR